MRDNSINSFYEKEDLVFIRLSQALGNYFQVSKEYRWVERNSRQKFADIVVLDSKKIVAVFEIKTRITPLSKKNALKQYVYAFSDVKMVFFILSDGNTFYSLNFKTGGFSLISFSTVVDDILKTRRLIDVGSQSFDVKFPSFSAIINVFKRFINKNCNKDLLLFLSNLKEDSFVKDSSKPNTPSICFKDSKLEDAFFKCVLRIESYNRLCRYTSLKNTFSLLKDRQQNMCCITCMNDISEVDYSEDNSMLMQGTSPKTVEESNSCFIISCMDLGKEDNLTMWRLYGDDAKGVNYIYRVNNDLIDREDFILGKVHYHLKDKPHPAYEYIKNLLKTSINGWKLSLSRWEIWKHFFKSVHFAEENEIRLLKILPDNQKNEEIEGNRSINSEKWILNEKTGIPSRMLLFNIKDNNSFPLQLERVIIGPKNSEVDYLATQFTYMSSKQLDYNVVFSTSKIDVYR